MSLSRRASIDSPGKPGIATNSPPPVVSQRPSSITTLLSGPVPPLAPVATPTEHAARTTAASAVVARRRGPPRLAVGRCRTDLIDVPAVIRPDQVCPIRYGRLFPSRADRFECKQILSVL